MSFLRELTRELTNVDLPAASEPVASYVAVKEGSGLLYVSGQLPFKDGELLMEGRLGESVSLEEGQLCARWCALNLLSHLDAWLDRHEGKVISAMRLEVFVASADDFTRHHVVANGASDLVAEVLGDNGKHTRAAMGVAALPLGAPVEVAAVFAVG